MVSAGIRRVRYDDQAAVSVLGQARAAVADDDTGHRKGIVSANIDARNCRHRVSAYVQLAGECAGVGAGKVETDRPVVAGCSGIARLGKIQRVSSEL